jgi:hypothetical protein
MFGHIVAHNFYPKILPGGSAKLRLAGQGVGDIFHSLCGPVERKKTSGPRSSLKESIFFLESPSRGRPEFVSFYLFLGIE